MKILNKIIAVAFSFILLASFASAAEWKASSFFKSNTAIANPSTFFNSGGSVVNGVVIGGENLFCIGCTGESISYLPLVDSGGSAFVTESFLSGAGYITGYIETDPIFNAASGDFLTGYTETDPVYLSTSGDIVRYIEGIGSYTPSNGGTFADDAWRATNPTTGEIVEKYFGFNSAYVDLWGSNTCVTGSISRVNYFSGDAIGNFTTSNTIYLLNEGTYTVSTSETVFGSCIAIIGIGDVSITTQTTNSNFTIYNGSTEIIFDGFSVDSTISTYGIVVQSDRGSLTYNVIINGINIDAGVYGIQFFSDDPLNDVSLTNSSVSGGSNSAISLNIQNTGSVISIYNGIFSGAERGIRSFDQTTGINLQYNDISNNTTGIVGLADSYVDTNIFCNNTDDGYTGTNALGCDDEFGTLSSYTFSDETLQFTSIVDISGFNYITGGSLNGYLTGYTETDPIFNAVSGDFLTGYTETDPIYISTSGDIVRYTEGSQGYVPSNGGTFADDAWRATNPTTGEIAEKLFGTNSAYVDLWTTNSCVPASTTVTYLDSGTGFDDLSHLSTPDNIYVLRPGEHKLTSEKIINANCVAIVSSGDAIVFSESKLTSTFQAKKNNMIVDNIKIDGEKGDPTSHEKNDYGINIQAVFAGVSNNTYSMVKIENTLYAANMATNVLSENNSFIGNSFSGNSFGLAANEITPGTNSGTYVYNNNFELNGTGITGEVSVFDVDTNIFCNNTADGYTGTDAKGCDYIFGIPASYSYSEEMLQFASIIDSASNPYLTGYTETDPIRLTEKSLYLPRTVVDTGFIAPGSDDFVPSTKAVVDYADGAYCSLTGDQDIYGMKTFDAGVKVSSGTILCEAGKAGVIKYSGSNFYGCNGTSWALLDTQ